MNLFRFLFTNLSTFIIHIKTIFGGTLFIHNIILMINTFHMYSIENFN